MTAGASAHVLLAFSDAETPAPSLRVPRPRKAKAVQERGHYISLGERDPHVASVAVPVFDLAGNFKGALAISGLIGRFQDRARQVALVELGNSGGALAHTAAGKRIGSIAAYRYLQLERSG